jgi:hypothetical protein
MKPGNRMRSITGANSCWIAIQRDKRRVTLIHCPLLSQKRFFICSVGDVYNDST